MPECTVLKNCSLGNIIVDAETRTAKMFIVVDGAGDVTHEIRFDAEGFKTLKYFFDTEAKMYALNCSRFQP